MNIKGNKNTGNRVVWLLIMLLFIIILGSVFLLFKYYSASVVKSDNAKTYDKYFIMIADDNDSAYWKAIYQSAYDRGQKAGVFVDLMGQNLLTEYNKTQLLEMAIASKPDGIILSADESDEMSLLISEADANGIPVITVQKDNFGSKRSSYVGVGDYNLGMAYGKQILAIAEDRKKMITNSSDGEIGYYDVSGYFVTGPMELNVTVLADSNDSEKELLRSSIQDTIESEDEIKINVKFASIDSTDTFSIEETIQDLFMSSNTPDIIVCLNEQSTECACQTVVMFNKVGQTNILGYYVSDKILGAIDRGVVYSTMAVDTDAMGAYCVDALVEYSTLGNTNQYYTVGITVIDKNNIAQYMGGDSEND